MDKICKFIGCTKSAYWKNEGKRGWCSIHYRRWQRHGDPSVCKYAPDGSGCVFKGYKIITVNGDYILEHRHIMEQHLGRKLNPSEIIHHINGNRLDNRIKNLMIDNQSNHARNHMKQRYIHLQKPCVQCNKICKHSSWQQKRNKFTFCSRKCSDIARRIGGINHIKNYNLILFLINIVIPNGEKDGFVF